ncbi:stimulator of interferon genes protein homolog isoform X1 [Microplitis demolitor]|uniref:stimulator of interferon genes protein homolog isoform X1 n=2 Tax=Microplitis demolitor TaxID=69319 RepID=UPI0004CD1A19|nr:stimulator of interferon genes protein homolog isoform X1 [Microplitis demolitor]
MEIIQEKKNNELNEKTGENDVFIYPHQPSMTIYILLITIVSAIVVAVSIRLVYKDSYLKAFIDNLTTFVVCFLILTLGSIILRTISFFAELEYLKNHYDNQVHKIFTSTFEFNVISIVFIVICSIYMIMFALRKGDILSYTRAFDSTSNILIFLLSIIASQSIGLFRYKSNSTYTFNTLDGVDYGTGMAYSYYYGYLKIILPSDGVNNPGLRAKMEDYEHNQSTSEVKITIPVKKLFILIPESGHIPPDLRDASNNWLESTTNLENEIRDRAGTKRRTYRNTVYKIHPGGEGQKRRPVYIVVEGATPMLTFYEILQHSHKHSDTYKKNRVQIIAAFYKTLQNILNDNAECRDTCELVYYKDYDKNGTRVNIGEILLDRIRKDAPHCC